MKYAREWAGKGGGYTATQDCDATPAFPLNSYYITALLKRDFSCSSFCCISLLSLKCTFKCILLHYDTKYYRLGKQRIGKGCALIWILMLTASVLVIRPCVCVHLSLCVCVIINSKPFPVIWFQTHCKHVWQAKSWGGDQLRQNQAEENRNSGEKSFAV